MDGANIKAGRRLTVWLPDSVVRQAKARADEEDRPTSRLIEDAVCRYLGIDRIPRDESELARVG